MSMEKGFNQFGRNEQPTERHINNREESEQTFEKKLNPNNPFIKKIGWERFEDGEKIPGVIGGMIEENRVSVYKKINEHLYLPETKKIAGVDFADETPIVDKKLGLVFWTSAGHHEMIMEALLRYHAYEKGGYSSLKEGWEFVRGIPPEKFIEDGYGYYISTQRPKEVHVGSLYVSDRVDEIFFQTEGLVLKRY